MQDASLSQLDASLPPSRAGEIARGTLRLLAGLGYCGVTEMTLANNRRADIAAVSPAGEIAMVEIKSSVSDFRSDSKWRDYMPFCDRFYFAVMADFPQDLIPVETGLIVADAFGGAVIREAVADKLSGARRKAVTLRLARLAAARLQAGQDAGWTAARVSHT
ncbi:MmcB family DNA repair protein [Hyphomonas sp.]|mgnify:FL=1|uniref:MmcB family DNA repair protein n=1 Tax=Hyphomonas sp. TaxID=87 RepID=UPI0032ED3CED